MTPYKLIGALLGIVGVSITVGGSPLALNPDVIAATLALLAATLSYATGGVFRQALLPGLGQSVHVDRSTAQRGDYPGAVFRARSALA